MSLAYEQTGDWRAFGAVAGLHALAIFGLLNVESVAQSVGLQQPLMVRLLTPSEPAPPREIPPPPPPPRQQAQPPMQPAPILAAPASAPAVEAVAPPPLEAAPLPAVLPAPTPAPPQHVAQAAVAAPAPAQIFAPRFDADYLDNPAPAYPPLSRRMGEHGRVLLRVHVTPDGNAAQVEIRESSGFERLDKAARDTVQRWRFVPARQGDRGVAAWVLVPISFSLRS
jgi:periplasmic protein TonB